MRLALTQPRPLGAQRIPVECGGRPLLGPLVVPDTLDAVEGVPLLAGAGQGVPVGGQGVHTGLDPEAVPQQPLLLLTGQGPGLVTRVFSLNLDTAALIDVIH